MTTITDLPFAHTYISTMKRILLLVGMLVWATPRVLTAGGYVMPRGGVHFPRALRELTGPGAVTAGSVGIEWGGLGSGGVGGGGSFLTIWDRRVNADDYDTVWTDFSGTVESYSFDAEVKRSLFTFAGAVVVDPLHELVVRPAFRGTFGPAMMIYTYRVHDEVADDIELTDDSGAYWGMAGSAGADLHVRLGGGFSLFGGYEYLWARLTKRKWRTNTRFRQDMSGPAVRFGMCVRW